MFERLKQLYELDRITVEQLETAVIREWITKDQKAEILMVD